MTAIPSTVVVPCADESGATRRLRSKGVNWRLTGLIFWIFRPQFRIPAVLLCAWAILAVFYLNLRESPGKL
jgi:hypothetical protein